MSETAKFDITKMFDDRLLRIPFVPSKPTLESELKRLYDLEVNVRLSSFWDGDWTVEIGDEMNGFTETAGSLTLDEVVEWLTQRSIGTCDPVILNDVE
jgi:hypothetical protein